MINPEDLSISPKQAAIVEPLLQDNPKRFVLFPIQFNDVWELYKSLESKFWTAEEVGNLFFKAILAGIYDL